MLTMLSLSFQPGQLPTLLLSPNSVCFTFSSMGWLRNSPFLCEHQFKPCPHGSFGCESALEPPSWSELGSLLESARFLPALQTLTFRLRGAQHPEQRKL
jgi:hypothetical protein